MHTRRFSLGFFYFILRVIVALGVEPAGCTS